MNASFFGMHLFIQSFKHHFKYMCNGQVVARCIQPKLVCPWYTVDRLRHSLQNCNVQDDMNSRASQALQARHVSEQLQSQT